MVAAQIKWWSSCSINCRLAIKAPLCQSTLGDIITMIMPLIIVIMVVIVT